MTRDVTGRHENGVRRGHESSRRPRSRSRTPPRSHCPSPRRHHKRRHASRSRSRQRERHERQSQSRKSRSRSRSPLASRTASTRDKDPALVTVAANLPAAKHREELLAALAAHQVVICIGETGSGKTTQIPQYLYEAAAGETYASEGKCIAITQPRRVATISVAQRVAEEMATTVGGKGHVGYAIRFDDHSSAHTKIKFMTDGILVRECLADPMLSKYSLVMLDEAHERSIHTDILFGLLKQLVARRPDFRLLVTSATLDFERFASFFSQPVPADSISASKKKKKKAIDSVPCPIVKIPGRSFPVDIFHSKQMQIMGKKGPLSTYVRAAVETTLQVHNSEPEGHILVFLTGQQEIDDACRQIKELHRQQQQDRTTIEDMELRVLPLYGALQSKLQRWIFDPVPPHVRKVIVATNIAETSLTIDGVKYVVDCGFTKQKVYNPVQQMESLIVVPISKVSAQQRAGRAGRTGPGKCYRLYSKDSYAQMMDETIPEIQRANLANTVLYLKLLGIQDVLGFPYLDPPDEDSILDALKQLYLLGALSDAGVATPLGKLMSAFPLEPKLSRALIEAIMLDCAPDMIQIVAMLSVENIFEQKRKQQSRHQQRRRKDESDSDDDQGTSSWEKLMLQLRDEDLVNDHGDHLSYLAIFRGYERARDKERWCEERQLRLRALKMATSIRKQIQDIMNTLVKQKIDAVKKELAAEAGKGDGSRSARLRKAAQRCTMQTVYRSLRRDAKSDMTLVHFHPQSVLNYVAPPEFCVYQELVVTSKPFMRDVVAVDGKWLQQYGKGKETVSTAQLFTLCGRTTPKLEQQHQKDAKETLEDATETTKKSQVDTGAISAARARFLARKRQAKA
uniref:RNA helicase n=1 Tax=Globisporangium ultimum (strain ATCC 200006 / CBS 805.95 / DAOM BR144) TaxID=431595 RepID=K3WT25_GLOUD